MALGLFKLKPLNHVNQSQPNTQISITSRTEECSHMAGEAERTSVEAAAETIKRECSSRLESNGHKFFWRVANTEPAEEILPVEASRGSTGETMSNGGEDQPILIRGSTSELGICIKSFEDLSVRRICEIVGWDNTVRTIDVHTQQDGPTMTMSALNRYWESCMEAEQSFSPNTHVPSFQSTLLNVVSLSLQHTDFENSVTIPQAARDLDLAHSIWPADGDSSNTFDSFYKHLASCSKPNAMLYALISPKYSYTDFHIDFGGSSVWYHVVRGEKVFLACPPSSTNLKRFTSWAGSRKQTSTFFGEGCDGLIRITVKEGDTVFLPGGWPHAVSTTQHSIVLGGNFLNKNDIPRLLEISAVEDNLGIPRSCRYPSFAYLMWLAACRLIERVENCAEGDAELDRVSASALVHHLEDWRQFPYLDEAQPSKQQECEDVGPLIGEGGSSELSERIPSMLDVDEVLIRLRKIAGQTDWTRPPNRRRSTRALDGDWSITRNLDMDVDWTACEDHEQYKKRRRPPAKRDKPQNPSADKSIKKSKSFSLTIKSSAPKPVVEPEINPHQEPTLGANTKGNFKRSLSANCDRSKYNTSVRDRLKKKLGFRKR